MPKKAIFEKKRWKNKRIYKLESPKILIFCKLVRSVKKLGKIISSSTIRKRLVETYASAPKA